MDTAKLELAVQRYREAEEALEAAHADVRAEAVAALREAPGQEGEAEIARITGWTPEFVLGLLNGRG
ncbi:hypothetical protein [Streptomyces tremellae]|uniref:Uncharacterized protein n=1 Tax=Streptomyces tremellae TaxID=1124239 RepID=A0ABP7EDI9_9ACTN